MSFAVARGNIQNFCFLFQEDVDAGQIILQEAVPVKRGDTVETLSERVKLAEHKIFPSALQLVASGAVCLGENGRICWVTEDWSIITRECRQFWEHCRCCRVTFYPGLCLKDVWDICVLPTVAFQVLPVRGLLVHNQTRPSEFLLLSAKYDTKT